MSTTPPRISNITRDDFTTDRIVGGRSDDHLIHHRDVNVDVTSSTTLASFRGNDILEGSVPGRGQIHMFASTGDDWLILDVTKNVGARGNQGHHAYGGHGKDTFVFTNLDQNNSPIIGRLDDFDPATDRIIIEQQEINLEDLPRAITTAGGTRLTVRVIEIDHPEFLSEGLGKQNFLAIGDNIFYALEGARDLVNGTSGASGEERHFLLPSALASLRNAETIQYVNPKNFVPSHFYDHRESTIRIDNAPQGQEVRADPGNFDGVHMFGSKQHSEVNGSTGAQVMRGSLLSDVIDGNTGNDTIFGDEGDDLIAGGLDNDTVYGGPGNDMLWGGDGNDRLYGGRGNDYLHAGRGNDLLVGGDGNDTLVSGKGSNTLVGGGGVEAKNRFHFAEDGGNHVITDFKIDNDIITLQHEIDPLTIEFFQNRSGNTVMNYGQDASVELQGVSLSSFQSMAQIRSERGDPLVTITPDPEDELLRALRIATGFYGSAVPPSLLIDGIEYGATAFSEATPGGYRYVSEDEIPGNNLSPPDDFPQSGVISDDDDEEEKDDEEDKQDDEASGKGSCFVATAAYQDPWHPDVVFLRKFRDECLVKYGLGRAFIQLYWLIGPVLARPVKRTKFLQRFFKMIIGLIVRAIARKWESRMLS